MAPASLAQSRGLSSYSLSIELDWDQAIAQVDQTTRMLNRTGQTLDRAVFQVTPAFFDAFRLRSATVQGQSVSSSLNGTVLDVLLPAPLASGASVEVELVYTLDVPYTVGRFSAGQRYIALGNFFPVLAVYRDDWDRHQYTDVGDAFLTETADFDLRITSNLPVVVASTGRQLEGDGLKFHLEAQGVRDFGLSLSPSYLVTEAQVGATTVRAYTFSTDRGRTYAASAGNFLRWYGKRFGAYPYRTFSVAEVDLPANYGGMEYPGLIFISSALTSPAPFEGSTTEALIGHEVAHQWFYSQVGNDQVEDPWLDEAFASYLPYYYYHQTLPDQADAIFASRVLSGLDERVRQAGGQPVDASINDFPADPPYFAIVYRRGAAFLDELRSTIGDSTFEAALADIVRIYADKIASPRAVLDLFQRATSTNLNPLISRYFSYAAFSDPVPANWAVDSTGSPWRNSASILITADFALARVEVWLDNRRLYAGTQNSLTLDLRGVEPGEYALLVRVIDPRGVQYERVRRVSLAG